MNYTLCFYCDEPVLPTDAQPQYPIRNGLTGQPHAQHLECSARAVIGSVAHLERRCGCYVPGSDEGDPPGMTARQAAQAALALFRSQR